MPQVAPVIDAVFRGCAAKVGPLIGEELELGEVSSETSEALPEGELAVLPFGAAFDDEKAGTLTLSMPLAELAVLGRLVSGEEDGDKEREVSAEDLESCGEVLNAMGSAVASGIAEAFGDAVVLEPHAWWRTSEPGGCEFDEGPHLVGRGSLGVSGGASVQMTLRIPAGIPERAAGTSAAARTRALLAGLPETLCGTLRPVLEAALIDVVQAEPDAEDAARAYAAADVIVLSDERDDCLELLRRLRKADATWRKGLLLCMSEPTRPRVIRAMECGASRVLRVPLEESAVRAAFGVEE